MKFKNLSIKWQIKIIVTAISLPFILVSLYNLGQDKKKQTETAKSLAISIARNIGIQQKSSEAYTRQVLSLISKLPELNTDGINSETLNSLFKAVLSENPQFAVVLSALPNGDVNASAIPFKPFSVADRKYFKDVIRTHTFSVGEFARSRLTNRPVFHYAMPVLDSRDSIRLILIASFDLAQYQNLLSVSSLPKGSDFAFYDYTGRMLYHSKSQQKLIGKRESQKIKNAILATTDEGCFITEDEYGVERLFGYVRINIDENSPYMYIVVSTPLAEAFHDANIKFYRNIGLTVFAAIFSLWVFLFYKNFLVKNTGKLAFVANKFSDGDFSVRTGINYKEGETGSVARALDHMANAIQLREAEKDALNKNLKKISERLEIAINAAKIGVWEWSLLTSKVFWNEQMYNLYNTDSGSFKGTLADWMKHLHPDDAVRFDEELHHSIKTKKNHKTSFRIKNQQKSYKNIRCSFTLIYDLNGKPTHIIGVNLDITERVFLEKELSHTKDMMESKIEALKTDFKTSVTILNEKFSLLVERLEQASLNMATEDLNHLKHQLLQWKEDISEELTQLAERS